MAGYSNKIREIFSRVSKEIWDCIGFASQHSVIGLENSHHPLNQSETKINRDLSHSCFPALEVIYMYLL